MSPRSSATAFLLFGIATLTACQPTAEPPAAASAPAVPAVAAQAAAPEQATPPADAAPPATGTDAWLGKWIGPEGTLLTIEAKDDGYQLAIRDLDGLRFFDGQRDGEAIRFERNGKTETIHATDGKATGMKWLADKSNCLTVHASEGYCRG